MNIGVANPSFSVWTGFFVNPERPIVLVVEDEEEVERAELEFARIGFDHIAGFLVAEDLQETLQITQVGVRDLPAALEGSQRPIILDVRSAKEYDQSHLQGTVNIPLPWLLRRIGEFSRETPLTVVCASGYRSSIATSLLESEGFTRLINVMGGMNGCQTANVCDSKSHRRSSRRILERKSV